MSGVHRGMSLAQPAADVGKRGVHMWLAIVAGASAGLASVPHCVSMCGPLVAYANANGRSSDSLAYGSGRLLSYLGLGALAGAFGQFIIVWVRSEWAAALTSWSLALAFGWLAYRFWRPEAPRPNDSPIPLQLKKPNRVAVRLQRHRPFLVGIATGFLPCGALAAALLIAAAGGSWQAGAVSMASFAIVSGVGLVITGWLMTRLRQRTTLASSPWPMRTLAVILALGSLLFVIRPLSVWSQPEATCHSHADHASLHAEGHRP